jgi:hypothetical protein
MDERSAEAVMAEVAGPREIAYGRDSVVTAETSVRFGVR